MDITEKRKYERVPTELRVKLPGDREWTDCTTSNVSGGGLLFEAKRKLLIGDMVTLQFMLRSKFGNLSNVHFMVTARVIRVVSISENYQIAVEFILDGSIKQEILKVVGMVKSQNLTINRKAACDAVFQRIQSEK